MSWNQYRGNPPSGGSGSATAVKQVTDTMTYMQAQVANYEVRVNTTLDSLQGISVDATSPAPDLTVPRNDVPLTWTVTPLDGLSLDDLDGSLPAPDKATFSTVDPTLNIPAFDGGVTITIPPTPADINVGSQPIRPIIDTDISTPDKPVLVQPVLEAFDAIVIPAFTFPTFPDFTDVAPEFNSAAPNVVIDWHEPAYASENFDLMLSTVSRMIAGGTGLPDDIERQLFDKARGREDITARKAVAEAFDTFATKGFTMPPGMLAEQINVAREANQLAVNSLSRDVYVKVADVHVENLRTAVQQGVAAENILYNIFNNAVTRSYEIAKFTVESQLSLYNVQVTLFNTYMNAYQVKANVYKTRLDAKLAEVDVYRAYLEGQKLVSDINQQRVQTFLAKIQALDSQVELYKAEMEGAKIKADVMASQIEAYKADVSAYAELIGAEKVRFDAYKSQIDGEVAKVGIIDANARVFASLAGVESTKADVRIKVAQLEIEQAQSETSRYAAQLDGVKTVIQAKVARMEAQARVAGLSIQNESAQSDANRAKSEAEIRIAELQLQTNLAAVQNQLKLYETNIQKAIEEARLKVTAMQAAGTMAATLAGGAMAAQHVQASISANSSDSTSASTAFSESASESWQYTPTTSN